MSQSPFEQAEQLHVGTVDFVSPDEIKVALDVDSPESTALNAGSPRPFPRVHSYLLVPLNEGYLVGQVAWITVEKSNFPKRRGLQDFGLVDLPYPTRRLSLSPLGLLRSQPGAAVERFQRGTGALPTIGAAVVLPSVSQLRAIVESGDRRHVAVGTSPLAADATVAVDPNRLYGRHLAVLGNTGSGKSCSVAGLVRWSLDSASAARESGAPNARFIILDPNGEYASAFTEPSAGGAARIFRVRPELGELALKVPLWFWNSAEWSSFSQASARTQRPLLRRALREIKAGGRPAGGSVADAGTEALRRYVSHRLVWIRGLIRDGSHESDATQFGHKLAAVKADLQLKAGDGGDGDLAAAISSLEGVLAARFSSFVKNGETIEYYKPFDDALLAPAVTSLELLVDGLGGLVHDEGPDEDVPIPFDGLDLADHLEDLAEESGVSQYVDFLVARIRTLMSDQRMQPIVANADPVTLEGWLEDYVGADQANNGCVSIIDLSLVPTEVVHVVAAVIARMVFEASQRYLKLNGSALPTVLVMEEAHTFIKRYRDDVDVSDAAALCCQVFERIAREGRKYGLGLVVSSQRPSELSPTVLSQCNTFLLHRLSNDRDQELVGRLVPDNLRSLLRELPSLPSQNAILLGWASELPVLVKMRDLPKVQQPRSDDPDFWGVWTGTDGGGESVERPIDWAAIGSDWRGAAPANKLNGEA